MCKDLTFILSIALILSLIYIGFIDNSLLLNSIDKFSNTDDLHSISLMVNSFVSQYPGARLYFVKDSSSYLLPKGIYVFAFDPYEPSNKFGNHLAKINGSQLFRNNLIFQISNIKNELNQNLKYMYNLNASDRDGQNMLINFTITLIPIPIPLTSKNENSDKIENFITNLSGIDIKRIDSAGSNKPGVNLVDDFFHMYPGAQAYYVIKSYNESLLPSNTIVYSYDPVNPHNKNGNRLASSTGIPTFVGQYGLEFTPATSNQIKGVDQVDVQENVFLKDKYMAYQIKPLYNDSNVYIFNFTAFMHPVPNNTYID